MGELSRGYIRRLEELVDHCVRQEEVHPTPSDFRLPVRWQELDRFMNSDDSQNQITLLEF
jgi:hypothetical protein